MICDVYQEERLSFLSKVSEGDSMYILPGDSSSGTCFGACRWTEVCGGRSILCFVRSSRPKDTCQAALYNALKVTCIHLEYPLWSLHCLITFHTGRTSVNRPTSPEVLSTHPESQGLLRNLVDDREREADAQKDITRREQTKSRR